MEDLLNRISVETLEKRKGFGRFAIGPLDRGFGYTLGNSLRRVLLESLPGAAITSVSISGVSHQFTTIPGVKEDVVEVILNLKKVRLQLLGGDTAKLTLSIKKVGDIKAGDIKVPAGVKIVNPVLHIASLSGKKTKLNMEMTAKRGRGYLMANEQKTSKVGEILLDAIFSPVTRVGIRVEATRVGGRTDLDKLIMDITTDETISPLEAFKKSTKILIAYLEVFYKPRSVVEEKREGAKIPRKVSGILVEELDLPVRVANTLRKAKLGTVDDLSKITKAKLSQVRNLGEKSIKLVEDKLKELGVSLA